MTIPIYALYDIMAEEYSPPILTKNDETAYRIYMNNIKSYTNGEDSIKLYQIGTYDPDIGEITNIPHRHITFNSLPHKDLFNSLNFESVNDYYQQGVANGTR